MWQAVADAEAATLQRKALAGRLETASKEAAAAAAAERAAGITAAGAASRHVHQLSKTLAQQTSLRAAAETEVRSRRVAAETALHEARRDLIAARTANAAATASSSDQRAATAAVEWRAFASHQLAAEEAATAQLAAEMALVQEQTESVQQVAAMSETAAEATTARARQMQQVSTGARLRIADEARQTARSVHMAQDAATAAEVSAMAIARSRGSEASIHTLTQEVAMAPV
jgi:hypothetical protein